MNEKYPLYYRITFILAGIFIFFVILSFAQNIFVPLAISLLFAILIYPVYKGLQRYKIPKVPAILISIFLLFTVLAGVITLLVLQVIEFANNIGQFITRLENIYINLQEYLESAYDISPQLQAEYFRQMIADFMDTSIGGLLGMAVSRAGNLLIVLGVIPIYTFLFIYYRNMFRRFFVKVSPNIENVKIRKLFSKGSRTVQSYVGNLVTVVTILAVLNSIGLALVGMEYPIFFGIFTAILTIIPYLGVMVGTTVTVLYAIIVSDTVMTPILVVIVLNFIQYIEGNFISPKLGDSGDQLNALTTIIVVFLGGMIWGAIGLLLFIPYTNILKIILESFDRTKPYARLIGTEGGEPPADIEYVESD